MIYTSLDDFFKLNNKFHSYAMLLYLDTCSRDYVKTLLQIESLNKTNGSFVFDIIVLVKSEVTLEDDIIVRFLESQYENIHCMNEQLLLDRLQVNVDYHCNFQSVYALEFIKLYDYVFSIEPNILIKHGFLNKFLDINPSYDACIKENFEKNSFEEGFYKNLANELNISFFDIFNSSFVIFTKSLITKSTNLDIYKLVNNLLLNIKQKDLIITSDFILSFIFSRLKPSIKTFDKNIFIALNDTSVYSLSRQDLDTSCCVDLDQNEDLLTNEDSQLIFFPFIQPVLLNIKSKFDDFIITRGLDLKLLNIFDRHISIYLLNGKYLQRVSRLVGLTHIYQKIQPILIEVLSKSSIFQIKETNSLDRIILWVKGVAPIFRVDITSNDFRLIDDDIDFKVSIKCAVSTSVEDSQKVSKLNKLLADIKNDFNGAYIETSYNLYMLHFNVNKNSFKDVLNLIESYLCNNIEFLKDL